MKTLKNERKTLQLQMKSTEKLNLAKFRYQETAVFMNFVFTSINRTDFMLSDITLKLRISIFEP